MHDADRLNLKLAEFRERIGRTPEARLADCLGRVQPDEAAWLMPFLHQYAAVRRSRGESVDFEEFRAAIPWIFESETLLEAAVDAVIDTGILQGQLPEVVARALTRAHPLTTSAVQRCMGRWSQSHQTSNRPSCIRGSLPQDFGPESLDGGHRYVLTASRGPLASGWMFEGFDRDDPSLEGGAGAPVEIVIWIDQGAGPPDADLTLVSHQAIARVRDVGVAPGDQCYMVYERIGGAVLDRAGMNAGLLGVRRSVERVIWLARGLEAAHACMQIHGRIMPTTVRVRDDDTWVLGAFGLQSAMSAAAESQVEYAWSSRMAFVSPESWTADSAKATARSDIYSLAAVLYWLITGNLPNGPDSHSATALLHDRVPVVREYPMWVPGELRMLCEAALQVEEERRPVSMSEWRRQLEDWLDGRPVVRDASRIERARKLFARHPALSTVVGLLIGTGVIVPMVLGVRTTIAEQEVAQYRGRYEAAEKILANWTQTLIQNPETDPALRLAMFDAMRTSGAVDDNFQSALASTNARSAREQSDRFAGSGDQSLLATLWHTAAAYLTYEESSDDARRYLNRARTSLLNFVPAEDHLIESIDILIAKLPRANAVKQGEP